MTKKIVTLVLAALLIMAVAVTAMAKEADLTGHTYAAYQIFTGTQAEDSAVLGDVEWADSVDGAEIIKELVVIDDFKSCTTAKDVADVLAEYKDDSEMAKKFAKIVYKNIVDGTGIVCESGETDLDAGYYLVVDTTPESTEPDFVWNLALLQLTNKGTFEIKNKVSIPDVEKKIVEGGTKSDAVTAEIGKILPFEFTGTMPANISDYDTYYYAFTDTMTKGLTYNGDVAVTVSGKTCTDTFTIDAKVDDKGVTTLKVSINDIMHILGTDTITADAKVVVTYTATVNEQALDTTEINKVKLTYSNKPSDSGNGANSPKGETPEDVVVVYNTGIKVLKTDGTKTLTGAKFSVTGDSVTVRMINNEMYVEDTKGTYYRLKDGTYTTTAPTDVTVTSYDNSKTTYSKVSKLDKEETKKNITTEGYVDKDGILTVDGIGAGTYTIKELVAPAGYNLLTDSIKVVITCDLPTSVVTGEETCKWSATVDGDAATLNNGIVEVTVINQSGTELPETGGIGTTIFYTLGSLLLVGAAILLITRKRMGAND